MLEDVWYGEVWVASGQSNMEWPLAQSTGGPQAAAAGCDFQPEPEEGPSVCSSPAVASLKIEYRQPNG